MRLHQLVSGVVAFGLIGLVWVIPQRGIADQPGVSACPADVVGNGVIDTADLVEVVLSIGPCLDCPAELTGDGVVDAADVMAVVAGLGGCASTGDPVALAGGSMHICAVEDGSFATLDGGCKDLATGLVWSTDGVEIGSQWRWSQAKDIIETSTEAGFSDWRMPTLDEWLAVIDNGAATHFGGGYSIGNTRYWSSTTQGNKAWNVSIGTVETSLDRKNNHMYVGGVREVAAPDPCNNNGICESGENCENCDDCDGKSNGPPSGRYCCGNGISEPPEGDGRCDGND